MGNLAGIIGGVVGTGMGLALQGHNDRRQLEQNDRLLAQQQGYQRSLFDYQQQKQYEMWLKTNYGAQVEQLKKAGLNPGLMYGMGGGGGTTVGAGAPSAPNADAPKGGHEIQDMTGMGLQLATQAAQIKLLEAQANKTNIEAENIGEGGVNRENIKADTALKVLEQVIKDYTGRETKDTYERVTSPNRSIQAKTYEDEMAARQGVAGTIYELWLDGKLAEKANNEIEAIAIKNAKTTQEINNIKKQFEILEENLKGAKLENIMKDLESKLQTQTGIDRNSPAWMKVLGRLFVQLLNK